MPASELLASPSNRKGISEDEIVPVDYFMLPHTQYR